MPHELIDLLDGFVNLFAEVPGPLIAQCSAYLIAASIAWCLFAQVRYRMMPRYGRTPIPTGAVIVFFFTSSAFTLLAVHPSSPLTGRDIRTFAITAGAVVLPIVLWALWANHRATLLTRAHDDGKGK